MCLAAAVLVLRAMSSNPGQPFHVQLSCICRFAVCEGCVSLVLPSQGIANGNLRCLSACSPLAFLLSRFASPVRADASPFLFFFVQHIVRQEVGVRDNGVRLLLVVFADLWRHIGRLGDGDPVEFMHFACAHLRARDRVDHVLQLVVRLQDEAPVDGIRHFFFVVTTFLLCILALIVHVLDDAVHAGVGHLVRTADDLGVVVEEYRLVVGIPAVVLLVVLHVLAVILLAFEVPCRAKKIVFLFQAGPCAGAGLATVNGRRVLGGPGETRWTGPAVFAPPKPAGLCAQPVSLPGMKEGALSS
mmetsp:Transcript_128939/g.412180  ORF Transcript_128939/g.412180 Transcript_128939/m.412180 type:complete len:301 (-) Transcript_128939:238-1140(-)